MYQRYICMSVWQVFLTAIMAGIANSNNIQVVNPPTHTYLCLLAFKREYPVAAPQTTPMSQTHEGSNCQYNCL